MTARPGHELPVLLLGSFQSVTDEAHRRLAEVGHPDVTAALGFAMQAIGTGATAADVGRSLGVSKQAAAKTIDRLLSLGYVQVATDPADARRRIVTATDRGRDMLAHSARIFDAILDEWSARIGRRRLAQLGDDLAQIADGGSIRLGGIAMTP